MTDSDTAHRLRTEWKKARNMFASFFTELGEVRKEIGDDKLDEWIKTNVHTGGVRSMQQATALLQGSDAERERDGLKKAGAAARRAKAAAKPQAVRPKPCDNKTDNENVIMQAPPPMPKSAEEWALLRNPTRKEIERLETYKAERKVEFAARKLADAAAARLHADNEAEIVRLRARVTELEEQLAGANETKRNETKPKGKGGRPCNGERPMTGYERLKAWRERQRGAS